MTNFFHKLFNPHCSHCEDLREKWLEESKFCRNCEDLRMELAYFKQLNEQLMNRLMGVNQIRESSNELETPISLRTNKRVPWAVKRQQLEEADRQRAIQLKENIQLNKESTTVEDLESELNIGGEDASK